jgi:hypothetical protein
MPTFVDDNVEASATAANITLTKPTGLADRDYMLAALYFGDDVPLDTAPLIRPPDGWAWVEEARVTAGAVAHTVLVFGKRADADDVAASDFTFTHASVARRGYITAWRDVSERVVPRNDGSSLSTSGTTTPSVAAFSTQAADALAYYVVNYVNTASGAITPGTGLTTLYDPGDVFYIATDIVPSAGAINTAVATLPESHPWTAMAVVLEDETGFGAAFPGIADATTDFGTSLGAANAQPTFVNAGVGDLVIAVVAVDNTGGTAITASTGWDVSTNSGTTGMRTAILARILDGSGNDTLSVTGAAQDFVCHQLRVPAGTHGVTNTASWLSDHVAAASPVGSSFLDPPSLTPPGGARDYLWIVAGAADFTNATSRVTRDSADFDNVVRAKSADSTTSVVITVAQRTLNAATLNPGSGQLSASVNNQNWTLAVPPLTSPDATATPTVVTAVVVMPAGSVVVGIVATPVTVTATVTVPAPTVFVGDITAAPPVVTATVSIGAPLVFNTATAVAERGFVYLDDYIALLPEAS